MKKLLKIETSIIFNVGHVVDLNTEEGRQEYDEFKEVISNLEEARAQFDKDLRRELGVDEDDEETFQLTSFVVSEQDIEEDKGE